MRSLLFVFLTCLLPTGALLAAEPSQSPALTKAANLYTQHCSICHGDNGDANTRVRSGLRPLPRDFTTVASAMELTRERMIDSVTNGRPGTGMMAHKNRLTAQDIASIVDYIRTKFMRNPEQMAGSVKNLKGEKTYTRHCSVCHGDKGNTAFWARNGLNPPPRNFTDPTVRRELSRERMIESVTHGRPGTGMMPFAKRLSAEEIGGVVNYIRDTFMQIDAADAAQSELLPSIKMPEVLGVSPSENVTESSQTLQANPHQAGHQGVPVSPDVLATAEPADMSQPFPVNLHGDVEEGRRFFMANCFTCHGVNGNGQGPRAYFNTPRPRDFTSEASRRMLNRVRLFTGIKNGRTGTVMPAWGKVLTDQQIANVAEFVLQTFILIKDDADIPATKKNL